MKTEYNGIEITYDEGRDQWLFDLRGRSRAADSLTKAKEAIDKEPKEKRAQTFPRFQAYLWKYDGIKTVTVTSLAEDGYYSGGTTFWVTEGKSKTKELDHSLFPVNDHNTAIVAQINANEAERERINEKIEKLKAKLEKATVPAGIK